MNKKSYITPQTELIIIANDAILAGSLMGNGMSGTVYGDESYEDQNVARAPRFNLWEDIDETNGYVDKD